MFKLALRNVFRQRTRSAAALLAIIVGVASLVLSAGFVHDIVIQLGEAIIHSQSGHIQVNRAGFFEAGARSPDKYIIDDPRPIRERIAALPEVDDLLGRISFTGLISNGRTDLAVIGEGVEPSREAKLGSFLRINAGRQLADADKFGILIGDGVATALNLAPGDRVTLLVSTSAGALNTLDFDVIGIFQSFSKDFDARAVRIPLPAAQTLVDTGGVNTVVVSLKKTADTARVADSLRQSLDAGQLEVKTWQELSDFYDKTVALYETQFGVLRLILLLMVLLLVMNGVNMTVMERVGEFGTMMALGNRSRLILGLVVTETALLGLMGSLIGVALGALLAWLISAVGIPMPPPPNSDLGYTARVQIVPAELALAFAVGLGAAVAAALLPGRRVARIAVVTALRQNA